jgi:hypothetical protein
VTSSRPGKRFVSAYDQVTARRVIVATVREADLKDIARTLTGNTGKAQIIPLGKRPVLRSGIGVDVRLVDYDAIWSEVDFLNRPNLIALADYNAIPLLHSWFPDGEKVQIVSVQSYQGSYRQQNICHVLIVDDGAIRNVTRWVADVMPQGYDDKHLGIHCDTSAYAQDIADDLGRVLYGHSLPYADLNR